MKTLPWLLALFSPLAFGQSLPAFYGAEGGGALSVGGRGGSVCQVTSLANSGTGTLRACIDTHNNTDDSRMTVVFRVGGTINLTSTLRISRSYITIAGHTAPGGGIQLRGDSYCSDVLRNDGGSDVIIRYLTIRKGRCSSPSKHSALNLQGSTAANNRVIVDHTSMYWTYGVAITAWGHNGGAPRNITLQNNIFAEAIRGRSMGNISGGRTETDALAMTDIDVHKNLFAHDGWRTPLFKAKRGRIINNIIYNWWWFATGLGGGTHADVINNLYKLPNPDEMERRAEIGVWVYGSSCASLTLIQQNPSIYVAGNQGPFYGTDNWNMAQRVTCQESTVLQGAVSETWRRSSPLAPVGVPITVIPTNQLESTLYPIVGDSRRLDCMGNWVYKRDSQDERIVNHAQTNYDPNFNFTQNPNPGSWPSDNIKNWGVYSENDVGGFPTIAGGTPCQDTDGDGMPDEWEDAMGLNKNDPSDRNQIHSSEYTMLEVYLNGPIEGQSLTLAPPINIRFSQ